MDILHCIEIESILPPGICSIINGSFSTFNIFNILESIYIKVLYDYRFFMQDGIHSTINL